MLLMAADAIRWLDERQHIVFHLLMCQEMSLIFHCKSHLFERCAKNRTKMRTDTSLDEFSILFSAIYCKLIFTKLSRFISNCCVLIILNARKFKKCIFRENQLY